MIWPAVLVAGDCNSASHNSLQFLFSYLGIAIDLFNFSKDYVALEHCHSIQIRILHGLVAEIHAVNDCRTNLFRGTEFAEFLWIFSPLFLRVIVLCRFVLVKRFRRWCVSGLNGSSDIQQNCLCLVGMNFMTQESTLRVLCRSLRPTCIDPEAMQR